MRLEVHLATFFVGVWFIGLLHLLGLVPLGGTLELGLYQLFGTAAASGWLASNLYLYRARGLVKPVRRRFLLVYLLGPPSVIYLLRALAPPEAQQAAPLAPILAFAVYSIFFLVPITLKPKLPPRRGGRR